MLNMQLGSASSSYFKPEFAHSFTTYSGQVYVKIAYKFRENKRHKILQYYIDML